MEYKHLDIGCMHLYDKEMRSTQGMIKNSRIILDQIHQYLIDNEDIILLNINGDIQHKTPTSKNREEVAYWRKKFREIGELMQQRFKKFKGYSLVGVDEQTKQDFKNGRINPIFVTRGNHDTEKGDIHTFFDDLVMEGLVIHAKGLLVQTETERTFFQYRDYDTKNRKIPTFKQKTNIIALEHNNILHEESSLWKVPNAEDKFLKAEDVVKGTDVVILHHIHESVDPLYITEKNILWQPGSVGRTSLTDDAKRDVGYGALMKFNSITEFKRVEFPLMPFLEYFSYKKMVKKKKYENEYENFDLKMGDYEVKATDYKEDINAFPDVEEEVKKYAIHIMELIEANAE